MVTSAGISHALARDRAARVSALHYAVRFLIPEERTRAVTGHITLTFELADASRPLLVDFAPSAPGALHAAAVNGAPIPTQLEHGHLVMPPDQLRRGTNVCDFAFTSSDGPLNRREDHLYTIFVPARAHEALPCFDQPDLKGRWALTLETPAHWAAIANGAAATEEQPASSGRVSRVATFATTEPLPTYLFAFAAGRFQDDTRMRDGRPFRVYHCGADPELVARNVDLLVDGHADALRWMEQYTGVAYPFGKFDIVLLPAFQFGGMEHPGAIFYNASALLLGPSATRQQLLARANVIAHETAHMWFGNLVTMTWFDDVWMKEVFANFMAAKIVNPQFPDLDHELRFLHAHYPSAYDVDRTAGANPIRQPLDNLLDAGSLYGAIIYLKSPIVMRQLERQLGEDSLRAVLAEYLTRHRFANASWPDLRDLLAEHGVFDVAAWSRDWIDAPGRPVVHTVLEVEADRMTRVALHTETPPSAAPAPGPRWAQPLVITLSHRGERTHIPVVLEGTLDLAELAGQPAPDFILPNGKGLAYADCRLDPRSRGWLCAHLPDVDEALTRGSAWLALWDTMLAGLIRPGVLLDVALSAIPLEPNDLNLQRLLHDTERLVWLFHSPAQRAQVADRVEAALRLGLTRADSAATLAALFSTFRNVATTGAGVDWLLALWEGHADIEGLALGETERIALAQALALRRDDGDRIVREQLAHTASGEARDALAFVAPALSPDPRERDRFFRAITDASNRRREPWVIEGVRCIHHPLRAEAALPYLRPGLELLEEIARTGDIFLPKRWLDAMLGGHQSVEAAAIVRAFLANCSAGYPAALRRMVLASGDLLLRER